MKRQEKRDWGTGSVALLRKPSALRPFAIFHDGPDFGGTRTGGHEFQEVSVQDKAAVGRPELAGS